MARREGRLLLHRPHGQRAEGRRRHRDDQFRGGARPSPARHQAPPRPIRLHRPTTAPATRPIPADPRNGLRDGRELPRRRRSRGRSRPPWTPRRAIRSATTATSRTHSTSCPSDRLGTFYTVPKTLIDALGPQIDQQSKAAIEKSAGESLDKPVSGALTASANSFDLQFIGGDNSVDTPESSLIGDVPAQSWLALGLGNLGDSAKRTLEQLKDSGIPNLEQGLAQVEQATGVLRRPSSPTRSATPFSTCRARTRRA